MNKKIFLFGALGMLTLAFAVNSQAQCTCVCQFPKSKQIVPLGKQATSTGTQYSFRPDFFRDCTGAFCAIQKVEYAWTIGASSTAAYTIEGGADSLQLVVTVTGQGRLDLSCTVTVTCGDKVTQCTDTGSRSFHVRN